jgi:hypothetical protein
MKHIDRLIQIDPNPDPVVVEETMEAGKYRQRRIDMLERWERDKVIEPRFRVAGMQFAYDFYVAGFTSTCSRDSTQAFDRVDCVDSDYTPTSIIDARDRVRQAWYAMGPTGGAVAWDMLGLGESLAVVASKHLWAGRNSHVIKGVLIGALSALADHYRC